MGMVRVIPSWVLSTLWLLVLFIPVTRSSVDDNVKRSMLLFMQRLSPGLVRQTGDNWGWNSSSDPCTTKWKGVYCDSTSQFVQKIVLEGLNFTGDFDSGSLCIVTSLGVLSLKSNNLTGGIQGTISNCKRLTHLYLSGNRLSGQLPGGISKLDNLKRLDVSNNNFSGSLPNLARISGLITFLAQNNQLSGVLPGFDFTNFQQFNVSNNNLTGPIPDDKGLLGADSFLGNPGLCGSPLPNPCPSPPQHKSKKWSVSRFDAYFGYVIIGLVVIAFVVYKISRKLRLEKERNSTTKRNYRTEDTTTSSSGPNANSSTRKISENRSEFSITSAESGATSLVVLTSPAMADLKFEDLLRAPAELLGRGKNGTLYKVILNSGFILAVKRIKDWRISPEEFNRRMKKVDQVKHPNVLPTIAFYCSKQEKLLVYLYQHNGSLFSLLHGKRGGETLDWTSRLTIASAVSNGLAFMHSKLREDGIPHGNVKSTNILFDEKAEPCVSEYGLIPAHGRNHSNQSEQGENFSDTSVVYEAAAPCDGRFENDVYGFGVVLLELLTGKMVQKNGQDLAKWVHSVVMEEWTSEVFDRALLSEGASEERMVNVLQVALRCISNITGERPSMVRVAEMVNSIKEEEERSNSSETNDLELIYQ